VTVVCVAVAGLALLPAIMTLLNLAEFRPPPPARGKGLGVSIVIPARDEAENIGACLDALRSSVGCELEIIVVDDFSRDCTPALVAARSAADPRVRCVVPPKLPPGWSGKPHACLAGAREARHGILLFIDADVRLAPDAAARLAAGLRERNLALASAFPREMTGSFGETLLVPLVHVLLLGYLPMALMRRSAAQCLGAGCGQIMVADAAAYWAVGGHGAVRRSWHDGVTLPRAFRARRRMTGIFDATDLATCRMYQGFGSSWDGFSKNAREALATPGSLPVWTVLLGGAYVAAPLLAVATARPLLIGCVGLLLVARLAVALRFRQNLVSVAATPLGVAAMLVLQWRALLRPSGRTQNWRGRTQTT
jgi:cellulose synthase/poly-beta-1,6-N-acetylglucosamine synthase-like glycosyltransferase